MAVKYSVDKVAVTLLGTRPAAWTFAREPVSGIEHTYAVVDGNLSSRNDWEFVVRVPKNAAERIEVRPSRVPAVTALAGLERRSLTFNRAMRQQYRGSVYCPVALADSTGEKSRRIISDKSALPRWFAQFESRLRKKTTVAATRGTDAEALVLFCARDDHPFMVRAFFACKVWVLRERFSVA